MINNSDKDQLVPLVLNLDADDPAFEREPLAREWAARAVGRNRAFVKVQDGCNNRCTFCITTVARGAGRSRPLADVVREI